MAEQPATERTEQPTPRRLEKARTEGQVPNSQELAAATALIVLLLTLALLGPGLFEWCRLKVEIGLSGGTGVFETPQAFVHSTNQWIADVMLIMLPTLGVLMATGILTSIAISGCSFTPGGLKLRWNALNPATVMQNFASSRSVVRLLTSVLKLFFVSLIVWVYLDDKLETLGSLRWAWSMQIMAAIAKIIFGLGIRVGVAILILGAADAFYQKWKYIQELKMTRQEVREERRDTEGSPEVKSRIRRLQIEMSLRRLKHDVPKANVVLVNPTHVAVALRYDAKTMEAPVLVAKGADNLAQEIMRIARSYGIPIVQRPEVARAIFASVKPGHPIPESLYVAVAEVLAMLYRLRQKKRAAAGR